MTSLSIHVDYRVFTDLQAIALYFFCKIEYLNDRSRRKETELVVLREWGIKNGIMGGAPGAYMYFNYKGYTLSYSSVSTYSGIMTAIGNSKPVAMLLQAAVNDYHWVLGVGYRQYPSTGDCYVRIVNGWDNSSNYYYKVNDANSANWVSSKSYSLS